MTKVQGVDENGIPRYMAPTIGKVRQVLDKQNEEEPPIELKEILRTPKDLLARSTSANAN